MAHLIGYARVSTADQNPQLQLDALAAEQCLKTYTDTATGTRTDRPQWNACLADLRPGDTLVIWKIDRLGRNLRDLIDIVTTLRERDVGVKSLTNGIIDTTTAHGTLIFYAYLMSQAAGEGDNPSDGLMLHPVVDGHFDEEVVIQGRRIRFATVDLRADGWQIAEDFLAAVSPQLAPQP